MRKIKPFLLTTALLLLLAGTAFGQLDMDAKSFYGQGILALPTGDFGDVAGAGLGAGLGMTVPYNPQLDLRAEIGYVMFGGEDVGEYEFSTSMIPIAALAEYHMTADNPAYFVGGIGLTVIKLESEWEVAGLAYDESDSDSELGLILGGGYALDERICVEGRYNVINDANYLSVHGTYSF